MSTPSPALQHHEKARLRAAAFRAQKLYPGVVGAVLCQELMAWEEFGYRLGADGKIMALAHHCLTEPLPIQPPPPPMPPMMAANVA